jgi:hypothetical protein
MYAIATGSLVYHLIDIKTYYTVCGQKVSRLPIDSDDKSGAFYTISETPENKRHCDACLRMYTPKPT